jgi:hypothetical protein
VTSTSSAPAARVGVVLPSLESYRQLLHLLRTDDAVDDVELTVGAPLWKGSETIKAALNAGAGLADKIDTYCLHGLIDEAARVGFARRFQLAYQTKHPRSTRHEVFVASGDVFVFAFFLKQPMQLELPRVAYDAIAAGPHDAVALARHRSGDGLPKEALRVALRVYLDFAPNPRRHREPAVRVAAASCGDDIFVIEADANAALVGWAYAVLARVAARVGGRAVWLEPTSNVAS